MGENLLGMLLCFVALSFEKMSKKKIKWKFLF